VNRELFMTEVLEFDGEYDGEFDGEYDGEFSGQEWEDEANRRRQRPRRSTRPRAGARVRGRFRPGPGRARGGREYVRWVQSTLNQIMSLRLPEDGTMGPAVRSAVRSFQEKQGLPVNGIVGPDTERSLLAARGDQAPAKDASEPAEPEPAAKNTNQSAEPEPPETEYPGLTGEHNMNAYPAQFTIEPFAFVEELEEEFDGEFSSQEWEDETSRRRQRPRRSTRPRAGARVRGRPRPWLVGTPGPSEYVRWVQSSLNQIMDLSLLVDGIMAPVVRNALRSFQKRQGLPQDGILGPDTERALLAARGGRPAAKSTNQPSEPEPPETEYGWPAWESWEDEAPPTSSSTPPAAPVQPPTSAQALRNNIASIAAQEWQRWGQGAIKECEAGIRPVLEDYWRTGVGSVPSQSNYCSSVPWSAAFISWVMRKAGAGSAFKYSGRHTDYVGAAKQNRVANNNNPFKTHRISEVSPRVGDLVCLERTNSGVSYDNVDQAPRNSHCDIVVAVQSGQIKTIGGNLSDSVKHQSVTTDGNGRVNAPGYYAVVRVGE